MDFFIVPIVILWALLFQPAEAKEPVKVEPIHCEVTFNLDDEEVDISCMDDSNHKNDYNMSMPVEEVLESDDRDSYIIPLRCLIDPKKVGVDGGTTPFAFVYYSNHWDRLQKEEYVIYGTCKERKDSRYDSD